MTQNKSNAKIDVTRESFAERCKHWGKVIYVMDPLPMNMNLPKELTAEDIKRNKEKEKFEKK